MFNAKRAETIRKNIQLSTLLSDHEKSDWLNLLELMNDKQLGELEEILAATPVPAAQPALNPSMPPVQAKPVVQTAQQMPPLSHIANVPTDVTMTHSVPAVSAPAAQSVKPQPQKPTGFNPTPVDPPHNPNPSSPAPSLAPAAKQKLVIENPSDVQAFTVTTLRQYALQSVADAMRDSIQQNGYFQILQQLEISPLYKSYIQTGKTMLGHDNEETKSTESALTQPEFEFITDLLRHMRFNAW